MLRDFPSGLTLAAVTGTLYALKMYLALLHWNFGDDACDLLVLVGIMLSATGFFGVFVAAARLNRRLLEASAEIDQRKRRFNESARARALRLNAPPCLQAGRKKSSFPCSRVQGPKLPCCSFQVYAFA